MVAPISPVVDTDDGQWLCSPGRAPTHNPEQRVVAYRQHLSSGKSGSRPAAQGQAEVMNELVEPPGQASPLGQDLGAEAFSEHSAMTARHVTSEPSDQQSQMHAATGTRQVGGLTHVAALDAM